MKVKKFLFTIGGDIRPKFSHRSYIFKSPVFMPIGSKILINIVLEFLSKVEIDLSNVLLISDFMEPIEKQLLSKIIYGKSCKHVDLGKRTQGVNQ
ncbi:MAG: hypothetical protein RMI01_10595, partial [Thermodesulfovibrio sp.]|nr:hypothetical protein [Thermodesulfovibrio sp.]